MKYENMVPGKFLCRSNRFVAHVQIDGNEQIVHVKNTGRCRELLPEGAQVWCEKNDAPNRKTKYDLICVQKGDRLINMDSQAPNAAAGEWLRGGGLPDVHQVRSEVKFANSRFDFAFQKEGKPCFMEVKGVTLENDGICAFPDAPTLRGAKHLRELIQAAQAGYGAYVLFVIQMENVQCLRPNDATDPEFGEALRQAERAGVRLLAMDCRVTPDSMTLRKPVPICL
ncbi:MAG: DNA/RNA nuclease SfsA [Ruminococcaceae bacterium]|nr:DNA/RNA nuclease SfsA [Oscillospiraceae bacterium]